VAVSGISTATAISAGGDHTCALLTGGSVRCWGGNYAGQLGNGTWTPISTPIAVAVHGISTATAISAGSQHTCALLTGGTVRCWGDNYHGDLGDGTTAERLSPVAVHGISTATAISASGLYHTCALLTGGSVRCWGWNQDGELGNGTTTDSAVPVSVLGLGPPAKTLTVSGTTNPTVAGVAHSVTVKALDAYGNVSTGYTGRVHFTSSDTHAVRPVDYTFSATDGGSHKFTGALTLKTAGARSVTVTDIAHSSIKGSQTITVTPGAAKTLSVSIAANPYAAGVAHSLTIKALDAYGNVATGYTGTIHITSSDSAAVFPGDYIFTGTDAGTHKFTNGLTLSTVGSQSVTATDKSHSSITGSQTVTVQ